MRKYIDHLWNRPTDLVNALIRLAVMLLCLWIGLSGLVVNAFDYRSLSVLASSLLLGWSLVQQKRDIEAKEARERARSALDRIPEIEAVVRSIQSNVGTVKVIWGADEVFGQAVHMLNDYKWKRVCICAFTGLWDMRKAKTKWLDAVQQKVRNREIRLTAIFGLPPKPSLPKLRVVDSVGRCIEEHRQQLAYAKCMLKKFEGLDEVVLHYVPPLPTSPGFGVILFEGEGRRVAVIALATQGDHWVIDTAVVTEGRDDVFNAVKDWFDDEMFAESTKDFVLQARGVRMVDAWLNAMKKSYEDERWRIPWEDVVHEAAC